jgi:GNAT superfamily N-acetyltransferase
MADERTIPLYVDPKALARDLDNSLSLASRSAHTPDDEAQLREASRRLGIPLDTARTDPKATKHALERDSFDAADFATRFPSSAAYLTNPENALVARDDVAPLSEVEQALRQQVRETVLGGDMTPTEMAAERLLPGLAAEKQAEREVLRTKGFAAASALKRKHQTQREATQANGIAAPIQPPEATPGNIAEGLASSTTTGFKSAKLGLSQQFGDLFNNDATPEGKARTEQINRKRAQLDFQQQLATPQFDTDVARWTYGGAASLAQTAPAIGLSLATGSAPVGLALMGLQTYGEAYGRYRGRGAAKGAASFGAGGEASVEVLTELLPMKFAVDRLGKAGLTNFFSGFLGRDMAGEQIATLAQDALDTAIANPTKTWQDYLAERPEAAVQTAFASLVQSGTLAAIGEGAGRLAGTLDRNQAAVAEATAGAAQLDQLMAAAAASMTRQRDPQSFAQLVQDAADDSGSAPSEIFIDARVLTGILEGAGMTPEQLAQSLPSVQEQLAEAIATDGAVAIPIGEATAAFAGSGLEQEFVRNARTSEDAWTAAEAQEGADLLAQLQQDAAKVLEEQTEAQAWQDSSNAVFDTLMGELGKAGRFTPDVNRAYATLVRNFYAVQAGKLGITPEEMYERFPLTVSSRAPGAKQESVLDQGQDLTEDQYIARINPTGKRLEAEDRPAIYAGDIEGALPSGAKKIKGTFSSKDGRAVQMYRDADSGGVWAVVDGQEAGFMAPLSDGETDLSVAQEYQGQGIGALLSTEYRRAKPFAQSGGLTEAGERTARAAFRRLSAEGVLNQSAPQTETPEFKAWFGDSKVVDENGEPLVVYHGTARDFEAFRPGRAGKGQRADAEGVMFFTSAPRTAEFFARMENRRSGEGELLLPTYLSLRNPLEHDFQGAEKNAELSAALVQQAKAEGHDGVILRNVRDGANAPVADVFLAFGPSQIKSATGNKGTFDPNDPNILNQSVPQTETLDEAAAKGYGGSSVTEAQEWIAATDKGLDMSKEARLARAEALGFDTSQVFYHSSLADVTEFKPTGQFMGYTGTSGISVTDNPEMASRYLDRFGESGWVDGKPFQPFSKNVMPVFVRAGQVLERDEPLPMEPGLGLGAPLPPGYIPQHKRMGFDTLIRNDAISRKGPVKHSDAKNAIRGRELVLADPSQVRSVFAAFDPEQAASGNLLAQQKTTGARATFNPQTLNIALLEKADLSSFLHETGHFFFEMTATLAADQNAPADIVEDMQALLKHVGYTGTPAEWLAQPLEARREAHETIAETFEQYLFTGKAPSAALQPVFQRFRSWLISVYRSLQQMLSVNQRASLNPDVAAVFDRMIASENAIAAVQAQRQFEPMFRSAEEAGMDEAAWAAYQININQQTADALDELASRTLRDLKWLDNAKGRKLKELQKTAEQQRKSVRDEVTAEVNEQPVYKAMEFLKYGRIEADDGEQIQIEVTKAAKLNIHDLQTMYPEGELGTSADWKKLGYGKYGMLSDAGLHPDTVAEMFGFHSGRQLVSALLNAEPKTSVIDGLTDFRMLERYGDITSPEAMQEAANEALANEARARLVATELKAVAKATGSPAMLAKAARLAAEQMVASKTLRNLRPDLAAGSANRARKAANAAMAKGDTVAAAAAKRTEILQVQLERAQRNAQKEHDKALANFKKIFKGTNEKIAKSRDLSMVNAARAVLARYGLAPNTGAANAQAYMALLADYDNALSADIKSILQGLPAAADFRDLTVEQFRGMRDTVNGLYYLSRRTRQMEIDGQKVEIDAVADELVAAVVDREGGEIPPMPGYSGTTTERDKWKAAITSAKAALTRVEYWAGAMGAPFKKYIWEPVSEATTTMRGKRTELIKQYRDLLKTIEKGITYNKIDAPELGPIGFTFNAGKSELLHALLHSGNQSNLTKLLLGRGWGTLNADGKLDTANWGRFITRMIDERVLTKSDFDFAQGVWDLLETIKVDAQTAHREMYGYYFNEVTADPIITPFGTYRGGYVPALVDSLSSPDMAQKREQEDLLHAGNSFMFPTTGKGFAQARVFYNKPLELDLRTIGSHLDKVARFAYLEPAIRDVMHLIGNKRVARALNGANPGAISDMLMPWLQRTATQSSAMPGKNPKVNKFFNGLRGRTGMVFMFGNVVNTLQQLTGFSLAALKVPAPKLLRATQRLLTDHKTMMDQVRRLSPWMVDRMANQSYAMQEEIEQILTNPNAHEKVVDFAKRNAYFLQAAMQNVMDPIIWTGAFDHAMSRTGVTEKQAVRYADEAVRTTQGSFAPEDIAGFEVQSPFVRLFTQFYGYFNMWGNLVGTEASKAVREMGFVRASPRLMFIWFAGLAIPSFVAELIARGLPDDEDDEDGDGTLDEWLARFFGSQAKSLAAMVPGVGHLAVLGANMLDDKVYNDRLNISPAMSATESAVRGATSVVSGEAFDEDLSKREVRDFLTLIGLMTGLPVAPVARAGGYAADVNAGKVEPEGAGDVAIGIVTGR